MQQLTVKELAQHLNYLILAGMGDKKIVVADDVEGNSYHGVFYEPTSEPKDVKELIEYSNGLYDSLETDPNNIVIIG